MFSFFKKEVTKEIVEERVMKAYDLVEKCLGDFDERQKQRIVDDLIESANLVPERTEFDHAFGLLSLKCLDPEASEFSEFGNNIEFKKKIFALFEECLNNNSIFKSKVIYDEVLNYYKEFKKYILSRIFFNI